MFHFFAGHRREREFDSPLHRVDADVAVRIVHHDRAFASDHLNPRGRKIRIRRRKHPSSADRENAPVVQRNDHPDAVRCAVGGLHNFVDELRVDPHRLSRLEAPEHKVDVVRRFHGGRRKLDAAADLVAEVARDVPAHERAHRLADRAVGDRALHVCEFRIETLGISDGEEQGFRSRELDQFIRFGQRQRNRLFQQQVFSREQRFLGHRVVNRFRRGGDDDGVDVVVLQEDAIIRGGRDGLGFLRHFLQARLFDFGDVQFAHVRARGARFRANASAPSRSDDSNVDLPHASSVRASRDSAGDSMALVWSISASTHTHMLADFAFRARHITTSPFGSQPLRL